jgi:dihydrofolate reductase
MGGQQVYEEALKHEECQKLYVTRVQGSFKCDAFFPDFSHDFKNVSSSSPHNEGPITYHFEEYERKREVIS